MLCVHHESITCITVVLIKNKERSCLQIVEQCMYLLLHKTTNYIAELAVHVMYYASEINQGAVVIIQYRIPPPSITNATNIWTLVIVVKAYSCSRF